MLKHYDSPVKSGTTPLAAHALPIETSNEETKSAKRRLGILNVESYNENDKGEIWVFNACRVKEGKEEFQTFDAKYFRNQEFEDYGIKKMEIYNN